MSRADLWRLIGWMTVAEGQSRPVLRKLADEVVDDGGSEDAGWALADHLGSVRDLAEYDEATDTTTVAKHVVYDAFGNVTGELLQDAAGQIVQPGHPGAVTSRRIGVSDR